MKAEFYTPGHTKNASDFVAKPPMSETPGNFTRRSFLTGGLCACCSCMPISWSLAASSAASIGNRGEDGLPTLLELGVDPMKRIDQTVWVSRLAPGLWLHTTTAIISEGEGVYFPANGLILEREGGSLLIDTGYLPEHAVALLKWSKRALRHPITQAVATHFHRDRTGGIPALDAAGIPTVAQLTRELSRSHGTAIPTAAADFFQDAAQAGECELFFPGAGHTRDNIVAWLPSHRVLFGGCFLKSMTSPDLGNLADAVVPAWADSVRRVRTRYPAPRFTVPGHGTIAGDATAQTLGLLTKNEHA
jgi:glyoxylase-like metal-dependent hydrolase (beta-lactamase superfamily II)